MKMEERKRVKKFDFLFLFLFGSFFWLKLGQQKERSCCQNIPTATEKKIKKDLIFVGED